MGVVFSRMRQADKFLDQLGELCGVGAVFNGCEDVLSAAAELKQGVAQCSRCTNSGVGCDRCGLLVFCGDLRLSGGGISACGVLAHDEEVPALVGALFTGVTAVFLSAARGWIELFTAPLTKGRCADCPATALFG